MRFHHIASVLSVPCVEARRWPSVGRREVEKLPSRGPRACTPPPPRGRDVPQKLPLVFMEVLSAQRRRRQRDTVGVSKMTVCRMQLFLNNKVISPRSAPSSSLWEMGCGGLRTASSCCVISGEGPVERVPGRGPRHVPTAGPARLSGPAACHRVRVHGPPGRHSGGRDDPPQRSPAA